MKTKIRSIGKNAADLQQELQTALVGTALQFCDACRRLEVHRRQRGFDLRCSRLLDEVALRRSLLLVLAEEVSVDANRAQRGARPTLMLS